MYLNKAFIIGNLTRDPELKALPSGTKVASFSLATNRSYKDKDGNRKDMADFHNIVAFGRLGELVAQYLKKGSQAYVEGRMQTRSWDAPRRLQEVSHRDSGRQCPVRLQAGSRGRSRSRRRQSRARKPRRPRRLSDDKVRRSHPISPRRDKPGRHTILNSNQHEETMLFQPA